MSVDTTALRDESPLVRWRQLGFKSAIDLFDYPWLEEVRSKVWNTKELEPELFRKVEVTQAHYTELQKRLNGQYSDRNLPEYDGGRHNVLSVKLDVLRSILPENEDTPEFDVDGPGPEARNEGGSGINSLFPFTLKFLDLTTLALKNVPPRLPSPLFIRQEYDDISALIWDKYGNTQSVVVSGQSGTGKTAYLYLKVIQFMIEGNPFLYQAKNGTVYHVNGKGVQPIKSWPSNEHIVAFIDADTNDYEPDYMFFQGGVQIILAAPPRGASARWIEQANYDVKILATKLWSRDELFIAGIFLYPLDISLKLLNESTSYFGYNPRACFTSSLSRNKLDQVKMMISSWITGVGLELSNMLQLKNSIWTNSDNQDLIVEISPINEDRRLVECGIRIVSRWAFDHFLKAYELQKGHATIFSRHMLKWPLEMSSHVFGRQVLNCLGRIGAAGRDFPIRGLTSPGEMTWTCRGPISRFNFLWESDFIDEITKAVQNNEPRHLVSSVPNFPAVDSILYGPNDVLTWIQTTVSSQHPINATGLQEIQSWLEARTLLAYLRPSADRPWCFIFIVPPGNASTFKLQQLEHDSRGEWAGKVHQYVLGSDVLE